MKPIIWLSQTLSKKILYPSGCHQFPLDIATEKVYPVRSSTKDEAIPQHKKFSCTIRSVATWKTLRSLAILLKTGTLFNLHLRINLFLKKIRLRVV